MKVELKDAKVEIEVKNNGLTVLHINGHAVEVPKIVSIRLIFGDDVSTSKSLKALPEPTKKKGCQTAASKKKLSASLKRFHANKRRKERQQSPIKRSIHTKHLNGANSVN